MKKFLPLSDVHKFRSRYRLIAQPHSHPTVLVTPKWEFKSIFYVSISSPAEARTVTGLERMIIEMLGTLFHQFRDSFDFKGHDHFMPQ